MKKLRLQQEPSVAEREQALVKQVAEARAARHARARESAATSNCSARRREAADRVVRYAAAV